MQFRLSFETNADELAARILLKKIKFEGMMAEEEKLLRETTEDNFAKQCDPDDVPWAAHAPTTKNQGAILTLTGAMRGSIGSGHSEDVAFATIGTGYAGFHQSGTSKMPQRRVIGIGAADRAKAIAIAKKYVKFF